MTTTTDVQGGLGSGRASETASALWRSWSWSTFLGGALVALATQIFLSLLGLAFGLSVGDRRLEGGYAVYAVIVHLLAITLGAFVAGYLSQSSPAEVRPGGAAGQRSHVGEGALLGVLTWATVLVFEAAFLRGLTWSYLSASAAWAAFLSALFGLAVALVGGVLGAQLGSGARLRRRGHVATGTAPHAHAQGPGASPEHPDRRTVTPVVPQEP